MSEDRITRHTYLADHGQALIDHGYNVVPIMPGKKAPGFDGWQKSTASKTQLKEWLENGNKNSGVGILTKHTPAIDIDVRDDGVALRVEEWVRENIGPAPLRIGRAPKRLMVYRTDKPFRKMRSAKWVDQFGDEHQIEILADGQQFVAYHKHPDTGKPYYWPNDGQNPLEVPAHRLAHVTVEQCEQLLAFFDGIAFDEGWSLVKRAHSQSLAPDADNPWLEDTHPVNITDDELRSRLLLIPNPEDYDQWVQIGMALFHQFDGDEAGLALWHEWSETADNYDSDSVERHWTSFNVSGKKRAPITARLILMLARDAASTQTLKLSMKLKDMFLAATDLQQWEKARNAAREAEIDTLARSALAVVAKEKRDAIVGAKTPLVEIKKAIAYQPKNADTTPKWCDGWVYDSSVDKFFHTKRKISVTQQGFNAMYDRRALTKKDVLDGKTAPSSSASHLALNLYKIPTVDGTRYMPGLDPVFSNVEGQFANLYAEHEIPAVPEKLTPRDKRNIERVKAHMLHLLSEDEAAMLLDWLSWVVQNPGKHMNYAVLLQGVEGDGKTFFAEMLRAVMGISNVTMLNAQILHSTFTDWTVGQCLACVEEVRLVNDGNKFEVLNRIKPNITNTVIEVHPKGKPVFNAINTTSYLLFSNYKDALPIDDNARRYLVLFSRWQTAIAIRRFKAENKHYYRNLYATIEESAGALRKWLLEHEQHEDFDPTGDAPDTSAKRHMVYLSKPEFMQLTEAAIRANDSHLVGPDLIVSSGLHEVILARGGEYPATKALTNMLSRGGYESLGKMKVDGEVATVWAFDSARFRLDDAGTISMKLVRQTIAERKALIESEAL